MKYGLMLCRDASVSFFPEDTTVQFDITLFAARSKDKILNQHLNLSAISL